MNDKKIVQSLSIAGVFVGFVLIRFFSKYFEFSKQEARLLVATIGTVIFLSGIMYLIYKKYYLGALILFLPMVPVFISLIGMYINNAYMIIGGLVGFFIVLIAVIKIASRYIPK